MPAWDEGQVVDLRALLEGMAAEHGLDLRGVARMSFAEEAAEAERARVQEERTAWSRRRSAELELAGVDTKHARLIVAGTLRETTASRGAHAWADAGELLLVLSGSKGSGKSLAAGLMVHRYGGVMVPASLLCDDGWWLTQGRRSELTRCTRDDLGRAPLLVIDDLGQEAAGRREHTAEVAATLVQLRTAKGLRTVITTNLLSREAAAAAAAARRAQPGGGSAAAADAVAASTVAAYLGARAELVMERVIEHGRWVTCEGNLRHEEARRRA